MARQHTCLPGTYGILAIGASVVSWLMMFFLWGFLGNGPRPKTPIPIFINGSPGWMVIAAVLGSISACTSQNHKAKYQPNLFALILQTLITALVLPMGIAVFAKQKLSCSDEKNIDAGVCIAAPAPGIMLIVDGAIWALVLALNAFLYRNARQLEQQANNPAANIEAGPSEPASVTASTDSASANPPEYTVGNFHLDATKGR